MGVLTEEELAGHAMWDFITVLSLIYMHHKENPDHGIDCACMDKYIRHLRALSKMHTQDIQQRVDYVIRKAIDNRH